MRVALPNLYSFMHYLDIYAITPEGGAVNIHTHIPSEPIASYEAPFLMHYTQVLLAN